MENWVVTGTRSFAFDTVSTLWPFFTTLSTIVSMFVHKSRFTEVDAEIVIRSVVFEL